MHQASKRVHRICCCQLNKRSPCCIVCHIWSRLYKIAIHIQRHFNMYLPECSKLQFLFLIECRAWNSLHHFTSVSSTKTGEFDSIPCKSNKLILLVGNIHIYHFIILWYLDCVTKRSVIGIVVYIHLSIGCPSCKQAAISTETNRFLNTSLAITNNILA